MSLEGLSFQEKKFIDVDITMLANISIYVSPMTKLIEI